MFIIYTSSMLVYKETVVHLSGAERSVLWLFFRRSWYVSCVLNFVLIRASSFIT